MNIIRFVFFVVPLWIAALHPFAGSAQTFNREGLTTERAQGRPVQIGDFLYVNAVSLEAGDAGSSNIYRYDSTGNMVRFSNGKYVWALQATLDEKILMLSEERRCTFNPDTLDFFIQKADFSGTLLASLKVSDGISCIVQCADSSYLAFLWDNKTMIRADKSLTSFTSQAHTFGGVWDGLLAGNGQVVISHNPGPGERLSLLSSNGSVLSTTIIPVPFYDLETMGSDKVTCFSQKMFYVYDLTLKQLQATPVSHISDYYVENDTIYALMRKSSGTAVYYTTLDNTMKVVKQDLLPNYEPVSIGKYRESSAIIAEPFTLSKGWIGHYLAVQRRNTAPALTINMALKSISIDSAFIVTRGDGFYDVYARLKFDVSATGPSVSRFSITTELSPGKVCGMGYHTQDFISPVASGMSVSLVSEKFLRKTGELYNGSVYVEFCSTVTRPDDEADGSPQNNLNCAGVSFDPTALSENLEELTWSVWPNPATGVLAVKAGGKIVFARILSPDGSTFGEYEVDSDSFLMPVSALAPGLYFIQIESKGRRYVKRFIKL